MISSFRCLSYLFSSYYTFSATINFSLLSSGLADSFFFSSFAISLVWYRPDLLKSSNSYKFAYAALNQTGSSLSFVWWSSSVSLLLWLSSSYIFLFFLLPVVFFYWFRKSPTVCWSSSCSSDFLKASLFSSSALYSTTLLMVGGISWIEDWTIFFSDSSSSSLSRSVFSAESNSDFAFFSSCFYRYSWIKACGL